MVKVALVGYGGIGNIHFCAYKKISNARVVAVVDTRCDEVREKLADDSISVYPTLDALFAAEKPDMIDICAPTHLHKELSIKALDAGVHVLCEKPMGRNTEETAEIIAAAKRSGKYFMTAQVVRFMTAYRSLKSVVDSGELGRPVHLDLKRTGEIPRWIKSQWISATGQSGGVTMDLSIHDIDFAQYLFGEPKDISALHYTMKNSNNYTLTNMIYDGLVVSITGGWYSYGIEFSAEYRAIFENGCVELKGGKVYKNGAAIDLPSAPVVENSGINLSSLDGFIDEISYFVDSVESGREPVAVTPESSENAIRLVEKILATAKEV